MHLVRRKGERRGRKDGGRGRGRVNVFFSIIFVRLCVAIFQ